MIDSISQHSDSTTTINIKKIYIIF